MKPIRALRARGAEMLQGCKKELEYRIPGLHSHVNSWRFPEFLSEISVRTKQYFMSPDWERTGAARISCHGDAARVSVLWCIVMFVYLCWFVVCCFLLFLVVVCLCHGDAERVSSLQTGLVRGRRRRNGS